MAPSALSARLRRDLRWALRCLRTYDKYAFAGSSRSALASIRSQRLPYTLSVHRRDLADIVVVDVGDVDNSVGIHGHTRRRVEGGLVRWTVFGATFANA